MTPERLRERVLSEWRGLPQRLTAPDRGVAVKDALQKVMQKLGLRERLSEAQISSAWREIVGDFIADHSAPSQLRDGVLYVQVIQPTVHYELDRVCKPQIVKKLKERFGAKAIREVRFRVG
jgi:predicted nucleic acid-binding Zn ribbon protein